MVDGGASSTGRASPVDAMPHSLLDDPRARLQFAGHETFPLRHGWLKKAYDAVKAEENSGVAPGTVFNEESAIATFPGGSWKPTLLMAALSLVRRSRGGKPLQREPDIPNRRFEPEAGISHRHQRQEGGA